MGEAVTTTFYGVSGVAEGAGSPCRAEGASLAAPLPPGVLQSTALRVQIPAVGRLGLIKGLLSIEVCRASSWGISLLQFPTHFQCSWQCSPPEPSVRGHRIWSDTREAAMKGQELGAVEGGALS